MLGRTAAAIVQILEARTISGARHNSWASKPFYSNKLAYNNGAWPRFALNQNRYADDRKNDNSGTKG